MICEKEYSEDASFICRLHRRFLTTTRRGISCRRSGSRSLIAGLQSGRANPGEGN